MGLNNLDDFMLVSALETETLDKVNSKEIKIHNIVYVFVESDDRRSSITRKEKERGGDFEKKYRKYPAIGQRVNRIDRLNLIYVANHYMLQLQCPNMLKTLLSSKMC